MVADLVPIRLSLSAGDRYTVWAPRWRDAGDEWEAFLGKDEDLYAFESVADLVAFVRSDTDNDLVDHPAWKDLTSAHAHKFDPAEDKQFDLVVVEELVSEKPTEESVTALAATLAIVSSIGSVCELAAVSKFFNGNPNLGTVSGGIDHFTGKAGLKRWNSIAEVIGRSWDDVLSAVDEIVTAPEVDAAGYRAQIGVAVEELRHRRQFAHRSDGRHDRQRGRQRLHRLLGRLLRHQLLDSDQIEPPVLGGLEVVRVRRGQVRPRRVVDQIVVGVRTHERDQVGDGVEDVEVLVLAQKRLPLVSGVAPAGCPYGVAITGGQAQADGHEVSNHAAHNSDGRRGCRTPGCG